MFFEEVIERHGDQIVISNLHKATKEQIAAEKDRHKKGKCEHTIIRDEEGWPYDVRFCVICNECLGLI